MSLREGSVIEFKDKRRVASVLCLKVDPKNVRVVNEANKEFNLPINKISHITDHVLVTSKSRIELISDLNGIINRIEETVNNITLSDLWELLKDEDPEEKYDLRQLTEIYFGSNALSNDRSSMFRNLIEDNIYFDMKSDGLFSPKSEKIVEQILLQKKIEEQKLRIRDNVIVWLKDIYNNENIDKKPEGADKLIELLKEIAVMGNRSEKFNEGINLLLDADLGHGNIEENIISILSKLGIFDEDQNLLLLEHNIPLEFSENVLDELSHIRLDIDSELSIRKDLRDLYTITIDDEDTKDIDDAISFKEIDNGFQIGVHIADAAHFVQQGTNLDKEAKLRSTTMYLPERKIEMLPSVLSEDLCSLVETNDRFAISVLINFDNNNQIIGYDIVESVINVNKRLSYKDADILCTSEPLLLHLSVITNQLRETRQQNGAIIFNLPELKIKVSEDKKITIGKYRQNSPSQLIVSELMVLSNSLVAEFLYRKKIPAVYRYQEEPSEVVDFGSSVNPIILMYKQRRFMKKSEVSTVPSEHNGLGLKYYVQMTSPIRRYSDLVIHRQIKSFLRTGKPFYIEDELKDIVSFTEHSLTIANQIQRNSSRYWLCKFLSGNIGNKTPAVVLEEHDNRYIVHLSDLITEIPIFRELGTKLETGQEIEVYINDVEIRKGFISIRLVKQNDSENKKEIIIQ